MERTLPLILQWDENFNVGADTGTMALILATHVYVKVACIRRIRIYTYVPES